MSTGEETQDAPRTSGMPAAAGPHQERQQYQGRQGKLKFSQRQFFTIIKILSCTYFF
jgi:hypothetical protein